MICPNGDAADMPSPTLARCLAAQSLPGSRPRDLHVSNLIIDGGRITSTRGAHAKAMQAQGKPEQKSATSGSCPRSNTTGVLAEPCTLIRTRWSGGLLVASVACLLAFQALICCARLDWPVDERLRAVPCRLLSRGAFASDGLAAGARMLLLPPRVSFFAAGTLLPPASGSTPIAISQLLNSLELHPDAH